MNNPRQPSNAREGVMLVDFIIRTPTGSWGSLACLSSVSARRSAEIVIELFKNLPTQEGK